MSDEHEPLSNDEIEELRNILAGHRAMHWLFSHAKGLAVWVAAIVGAWIAFSGVISGYIRRVIEGSP